MENLTKTKFHCTSCNDKNAEEKLEDYGNDDKIGVCTVCGALVFHRNESLPKTSVLYDAISKNVLHVA
jgi:transcription elongation factor Elf1